MLINELDHPRLKFMGIKELKLQTFLQILEQGQSISQNYRMNGQSIYINKPHFNKCPDKTSPSIKPNIFPTLLFNFSHFPGDIFSDKGRPVIRRSEEHTSELQS